MNYINKLSNLNIFNKVDYEDLVYIYEELNNLCNKSESELLYIMDLLFDDKENFVNISVKDMLFKKYNSNFNIISKYDSNIKKANNLDEFLLLFNKRNSYILFESFIINNIDYYIILWERLHS